MTRRGIAAWLALLVVAAAGVVAQGCAMWPFGSAKKDVQSLVGRLGGLVERRRDRRLATRSQLQAPVLLHCPRRVRVRIPIRGPRPSNCRSILPRRSRQTCSSFPKGSR
jgi:hypothetical protein